ncbi:MAG: DUF3108 domain-containing protein [Mesorhizobium sp.]|nr:DUF3108 domain-containing protein [Mesorhizobium sp.]MBL8576331.1 DUF3108 domain-containing protein [Mesorhizobium sp.]
MVSVAVLASSGAATRAETPGYRGEFTISFLGLPVARIDFDSRMEGESYKVEGKVESAGLGAFFYDTKGTLTATGRVGDRIEAESFRAQYSYDGKPTLVDIRFAGGNVVKVVNEPPLKKRGSDWVPIPPEDLKSVVDPLAASLVKADKLEDVCKGSSRMFDGELRADLALSFVGTGTMSVEGFEGPTVTCRLTFTPSSGYRKGRRSLEYLRTKSRIMVTFAQIGETGIYAPIHATIGTQIGTITVRARRFEATKAS